MSLMENDFNAIVKLINENGYCELPNFFSQSEHEIICHHVNVTPPNDSTITRNKTHPLYKMVSSGRILNFFMGLADARLKRIEKLNENITIPEDQFAIGVAKKWPSFGNAKMHRLAFHYDDSYLNAVYAIGMPHGSGAGLMIYNNLRRKLGYGVFSKVISRVIGRNRLIRKIFKPRYVKYKSQCLYIFFGDVTLHGVGNCFDGDRISFAINLSRIDYPKFKETRSQVVSITL